MQGLRVTKLSGNVIAVDRQAALMANPQRIVFGMRPFHQFRRSDEKTFYIAKLPSDLEHNDITAINRACDTHEKPQNRAVKNVLAKSLQAHFNGKAFHVYEMGSGRYPISPYFGNADLSFHAIETDPSCIDHMHRMNIPASNWETALAQGVPEGKPSVGVSVYALHFLANSDLAAAIDNLTSMDGFMVGNFYIHPEESRTGVGRKKLAQKLNENDIAHIVIKDPADRSNEYWIMGRMDCRESMASYAMTLQNTLYANAAASSRRPAPA